MSEDTLAAVRKANRTALSRLGSSKALYAATDGEMTPATVLGAAAMAAAAAAGRFESSASADDDDGDVSAAEAFAETAADEWTHHDRIVDARDDDAGDDLPTGPLAAAVATLADADTPADRAGGLLGWALVADAETGQHTAFFVGQADPTTSQLFRDHGDVRDRQIDRAVALIDALDTDGRARARETAGAVIQAAYETYTDRLETLGINPKPVC